MADYLQVGDRSEGSFTVTPREMIDFAALTGDRNPVHFDAAYARERGLEAPVVFGALLVAKAARIIGMELPGRDCLEVSIAMTFHKPLYVGRAANIEAIVKEVSEATGLASLEFKITAEKTTIARGKAEVLLSIGIGSRPRFGMQAG
jgi:3-hydroxybutyryl-CoA dehydratase